MSISTHVLDTVTGRPAAGVAVALHRLEGDHAIPLGRAETDSDGRVRSLMPPGLAPVAGVHRMTFEVGAYFAARGLAAFYPRVEVSFEIREPGEPLHVPLLLAPFGYATYRGS